MSRLIDISPWVSPSTAVFPGDTPFSRSVAMDMEQGEHLTLSSITTTVHIGAHTDAPNHYERGAADIGSRDLSLYYGPCQVVQVSCAPGARIGLGDVSVPIEAPRVLFRTDSFPDPDRWNDDFNSLSPELIDDLHARGVCLVGIDTPSIDPATDKVLASHRAVASHDMAILEGILLSHVAPGAYTLLALPLKIRGADAAPVRAALLAP